MLIVPYAILLVFLYQKGVEEFKEFLESRCNNDYNRFIEKEY